MKNRREQGFTIIEMVALLVMTTTALLFLYHITSLTLESKRLQIVARELGRDTSETCFRFSQESRTVRSNIDLLIATNNEVRFINTTGTTIRYWLSGNNLMRNNQILLDQMNALNFTSTMRTELKLRIRPSILLPPMFDQFA